MNFLSRPLELLSFIILFFIKPEFYELFIYLAAGFTAVSFERIFKLDEYIKNVEIRKDKEALQKRLIEKTRREERYIYDERIKVEERKNLLGSLHHIIGHTLTGTILEFTDIKKYENYFPKKLSGGLKRRLNIACGIAHKPDFLVLDEPTVAVDAESRSFILNQIKNLRDQGVSVIYTTHYMEEVEEIADEIVIIKDGQNIASGSLYDLLSMIDEKEKIRVDLGDKGELKNEFLKLENVKNVDFKDAIYEISFQNEENNMRKMIEYLDKNNLVYNHIYSEKPRLNQIYLELTGKELK